MTDPTAADPVLALNYSPWLPDDLGAPILDLGCGDGRVLRFLSVRGYRAVHGVDRDARALATICQLPGVTVECTEVGPDYLRQQRGRFKLIILKQMIYYIDRTQIMVFMAALKAALTDDGVILVEYFNASLLSSRFTELKDPFILTAYTEHSMRRLMVASGFEVWHVGAEQRQFAGLRFQLYAGLRALWLVVLRAVYILERGYDDELPRIDTKSIIAVAGKTRRP